MKISLRAIAILLIFSAACSYTVFIGGVCPGDIHASAPSAFQTPGTGGAPIVLPEALEGCRTPAEPNCETCCYYDGYSCTTMNWSPDTWDSAVEPWYNKVTRYEGECAPDCFRCARCSQRSEEQLRGLLAEPTYCDCTVIEIGVDPCYAPASCECYCEQLEVLISQCPLAP